MNYSELFELKALVDNCSAINLTAEKRSVIFKLMDSIDSIIDGLNKQMAKTYGGRVVNGSIDFSNIVEQPNLTDAEKQNKLNQIIDKVNADLLQDIPNTSFQKLDFNFLDSSEFETFVKSYDRCSIKAERTLQKYLLK